MSTTPQGAASRDPLDGQSEWSCILADIDEPWTCVHPVEGTYLKMIYRGRKVQIFYSE